MQLEVWLNPGTLPHKCEHVECRPKASLLAHAPAPPWAMYKSNALFSPVLMDCMMMSMLSGPEGGHCHPLPPTSALVFRRSWKQRPLLLWVYPSWRPHLSP